MLFETIVLCFFIVCNNYVDSSYVRHGSFKRKSPQFSSSNKTYSFEKLHFDTKKDQQTRRLSGRHGDYIENDFFSKSVHKRMDGKAIPILSKNIVPFGRNYFWDTLWPTFDTYKTSSVWTTSSSDRPTFSKSHVIVLPIYWDGDSMNSNFDRTVQETMMQETAQQYRDMSWGKLTLTWEMWDRVVLPGVTRWNADFTNSAEAVEKIVKSRKYKKGIDFTGIVMLYDQTEKSPFNFAGGWGYVNGDLIQQTFDAGYEVLRHELGHNYGHYHHLINDYRWRFKRGNDEHEYDGFDFMSGGNGFRQADLAAASKWYFNWIPNDSIVLMQPEGPNSKCRNCVSSVKDLILSPFDDPLLPPSTNTKMAVQIPITGTEDEQTAFSYWLSYRGVSVDGKASKGLSVHVSWFRIYGDIYGGDFDSLNYDAFGSSSSRFDSFVAPGTCYVIPPSGKTMDVDPASSNQIQPVVCVSKVDPGKSITISVSFLTPNAPPPTIVTPASSTVLKCSSSGTSSGDISLDLSNNKFHLLHFNNTGLDGSISLSMCRNSSSSPSILAYFYDSLPYSYLAYNSPKGYGAYKSHRFRSVCTKFGSSRYQTQNGQAYILIARSSLTSSSLTDFVTVRTNCKLSGCAKNEYLGQDGQCTKSPQGMISAERSRSIADCVSCSKDGMVVADPKMNACMLPLTYDASLTTALEWRLLTLANDTESKWKWDVNDIRFYSTETCSSDSIVKVDSGIAFESGNAGFPGFEPMNAFDNSSTSIWGGRPDKRDLLWIGMTFPSSVTVKCITFNQLQIASDVWIQTRSSRLSEWRNTWVASGLTLGENTISIKG